MTSQVRPSETLGSKKLQALRAIKAHFRESGKAPSYLAIGRALDVSSKRAFELVRVLAADGDVILTRGVRGVRVIVLPDPGEMMSYEDVLLQLQARGFVIFQRPPDLPANDQGWPLTCSPLPLLPELDDMPATERDDDDFTDLQP